MQEYRQNTLVVERSPVLANAKAKSSLWENLAPYLVILSFASLIFWRLPGLMAYEGDDVACTLHCDFPKLPTSFPQYLAFIGIGRGYMRWTYYAIYNAFHQTLDVPVILFVLLFAGSALYLFNTLRRFTSTPTALISSLLYLCLFAKYEAVTKYHNQLYIAVIFSGIVMLRILTSKLSRGVQCLIIAPLFWAGIHIYEILMVLVPLFPFFWLGPSLVKKKFPCWRDVIYSAVPAAITAMHIGFIAIPKPSWNANGHKDLTKLPLYAVQLSKSSIDSMIGAYHWNRLIANVGNFFKFDICSDHSLWLPLVAVGVCSLWLLHQIWSQPKQVVVPSRLLMLSVALTGLYLFFLGPLIAVGEYTDFVPSRLLFLPLLGFALASGAGIEFIRKEQFYRGCATALLLWCVVETIAFAGIVHQGITAIAVDRNITNMFTSIPGFQLRKGAHVFVSLPFTSRQFSGWLEFRPQYYYLDPLFLWNAFNLGVNTQKYDQVMRTPYNVEPVGMENWLNQSLKQTPAEELAPFYLDDNFRLRPITAFCFLERYGRIRKTIFTGLQGHVPSATEMHMNFVEHVGEATGIQKTQM